MHGWRIHSSGMRPSAMTWLRALCCFALAGGCAPYLRDVPVETLAFRPPERCGQGPYDVELPATGGRWGESVEVLVYSPHALELEYEVSAGGSTAASGDVPAVATYVSTTNSQGDEQWEARETFVFDNSSCTVATLDAALVDAPRVEGRPVGTPTTPPEETPPDAAFEPAAPVATPSSLVLQPVEWEVGGRIDAQSLHARGLGVARVSAQWHPRELEPPLLEAGQPIRVRVYSTIPNPLEGVTFVIVQSNRRPNVSEEEYLAYLQEKAAEEEREQLEREAEARERSVAAPSRGQRRRAARAEERAREARERPITAPSRRQRRRTARAEARAREVAERREFCDAHRESEECWGEGGYEGQQRRAAEREAALEAARHAEPDGPPPPPRAEVQGPKPSLHALWVPGYWRWIPREWVWIAGRWNVPEADLAAETVVAPAAPPPPPQETVPPPPAAGMAWVGGHWQWDGARFVWITGYWDVPQTGAVYQPPIWRVRGSGAVFVPGRWEIRVGP